MNIRAPSKPLCTCGIDAPDGKPTVYDARCPKHDPDPWMRDVKY